MAKKQEMDSELTKALDGGYGRAARRHAASVKRAIESGALRPDGSPLPMGVVKADAAAKDAGVTVSTQPESLCTAIRRKRQLVTDEWRKRQGYEGSPEAAVKARRAARRQLSKAAS